MGESEFKSCGSDHFETPEEWNAGEANDGLEAEPEGQRGHISRCALINLLQTETAPDKTLKINFNFLRASPHPSAGIARLSQHRECLSQSLTNAGGRASSVS